jgi:hypothetical protein
MPLTRKTAKAAETPVCGAFLPFFGCHDIVTTGESLEMLGIR